MNGGRGSQANFRLARTAFAKTQQSPRGDAGVRACVRALKERRTAWCDAGAPVTVRLRYSVSDSARGSGKVRLGALRPPAEILR